jgi:hypothetical protein
MQINPDGGPPFFCFFAVLFFYYAFTQSRHLGRMDEQVYSTSLSNKSVVNHSSRQQAISTVADGIYNLLLHILYIAVLRFLRCLGRFFLFGRDSLSFCPVRHAAARDPHVLLYSTAAVSLLTI